LVADALDAATGLEVKLKWPNDLLLGSEKCGGILIDVDGDLEGAVDVIIGIGINVDMAGVDAPQIAQPWTDLNAHTPAPVSRNKIASGVIAALQMGIAQFQEGGFTLFRDRWLARDALAGMPISVSGVGQTLDGLAMGVSVTGGLLIRAGMHTIEVNSGDVSVRLQ
jgi:BirA family biotin operon repressor/biotin-[acetyl-CoA-carboxylase] ligase